MAHEHDVQDSDKRFVIDPITRSIVNQSGKIVLMEGDHNSEVFTFEMPRYVDGHDMTKCNEVRIHYLNKPDGTSPYFNKDVYEVSDLRVDPENDELVIFSWLVSGNATGYAGSLNFAIKFSCVVNGVVQYKWGTGVHSGLTVGMSIENGEIVVQEYSDILEQWKSEILADLDTRIETAVDARVGTTIDAANEAAVSAQTQAALAAEAAISVKAYTNVLKSEQTGEIVRIDDAFPADILETTVYGQSEQMTTTGKNLFNPSYLLDAEGWTFADGIYSGYSATLHNVYNEGYPFDVSFEPNTQYTLSFKGMTDNSVNENSGVVFRMIYTDGTMSPYIDVTASSTMNDYKFTTPSNKSVEGLLITYRNYKLSYLSEIQLELGTEATEYEPYSGGKSSPSPDYPQDISSITSVDLVTTGKNLWRFNYSGTSAGLTFSTVDGVTTVTGTPSRTYAGYNVKMGINEAGFKAGETYCLEANLSSNSTLYAQLSFQNVDGSLTGKYVAAYWNKPTTFTVPEDAAYVLFYLQVGGDTSSVNVTARPQIELGTTVGDWVSPSDAIPTSIDLAGNKLRSLPNGIQDELVIDAAGNYGIVKRIGFDTITTINSVLTLSNGLPYIIANTNMFESKNAFQEAGGSARVLCDRYPYTDPNVGTNLSRYCYRTWNAVIIVDDRFTSVEEAKVILAEEQPYVECLAPVEYIPIGTLDTPLALPENTSNVWAVTNLGTTVKVKYVQDINIVINNLIGGVQNG